MYQSLIRMLFHLAFFFLIIDLYILILAIIAQIFTPTVELIISSEISIKEAKSEMEIQTVTTKLN